MSEAAVLSAVQDYLAAIRVPCYRMNSGAVKVDTRFFRFGQKGMADLLALVPMKGGLFMPAWIETKTKSGRQSEYQKSFEDEVLDRGMKYFVIRDIEGLKLALASFTT